MDGAFLFSANPASIRGLCEEWSRRGFSPESFSPRPSRRLRVQFPPEFSVSYRRRPILSVSSKTCFCDVMRCFRHLNRVFRNQRGSESWDRFWHLPQKSHSSRAEFHFAVSKTPFTRPIPWFFPQILVFWKVPFDFLLYRACWRTSSYRSFETWNSLLQTEGNVPLLEEEGSKTDLSG